MAKSKYTAAERRTLKEAIKRVKLANDVDEQTIDTAAANAFKELVSQNPKAEDLFKHFRDFHNASIGWITGTQTVAVLRRELK